MADTSSKHNILVTDNGSLKNVNKSATELKNTLDAAGTAAERTTAKVKKASAPTPVAAARAARDAGGQAAEDSGTARGIGGLTGAAGRDFAKQSQGLGGLVRLYATFAANIFAATAAFGALSRAADTTNMVKGLDQLGAASGKNLSLLAKQVTLAADGAISLRESLEVVAKASAAGMSNKQIEDMAESAKKASQALGVNMSDAISRLTRGISKLEPELLDELGLFTKVDKSTQDYARSIGKAVTSLSDFERRQAFANAVLDEAKQKFSAIDIPANPYTKLLANLQNVAFAGLELVNKVLGPIAKVLADSPTALATAMAYIGAILLKTAIPAIGMWKEGLKASADEARKTAKAFRESFNDEFQQRMEARFSIPDIKKKLDAAALEVAKNQAKINAITVPPKLASANALAAGDTSTKTINNVTRALEKRQAQLEAERVTSGTLKAETKARLEQETASLEKLLVLRKKGVLLKQEELLQEKVLASARASLQDQADKPLRRTDTEMIAQRRLERLEKSATKGNLVATAATNATIIGVRNSMAALNKEITDNGLKGWDKWSTVAKGGIAAVSARVMGILGSLGNVGMAVGIAVGAFQLLDTWLSKNTKQLEALSNAMETVNTAATTVTSTLNNLSARSDFGISVQGIQARATAFSELTDSLAPLSRKLKEAQEAGDNWWDASINWIKKAADKDLQSTYVDTISNAVMAGLRVIDDPTLKAEAERNIRSLFTGMGTISKDSLKAALNASGDIDSILPKVESLIGKLKTASNTMSASAQKVQSFGTTMTDASKAFDEFTVSLNNSDPLSKLANQTISAGFALRDTFKDVNSGLASLISIGTDASKLRFLPVNAQKELLAVLPQLEYFQKSIGQQQQVVVATSSAIQDYTDKIAELRKTASSPFSGLAESNSATEQANALEKGVLAQLKLREKQAQRDLEVARSIAADLIDSHKKAAKIMVDAGVVWAEKALTTAQAIANINYLKTATSTMSGVGTSQVQTDLAKRSIDVQLQSITAMENLTFATNRTALVMQEAELSRKLKEGTPVEQATARATLPTVQAGLQLITTKNSSDLVRIFNTLPDELKAALEPFYKSAIGNATQRAKLSGEKASLDKQNEITQAKELADLEQRRNQFASNLKALEVEKAKLVASQGAELSETLRAELELVELSKLRLDSKNAIAAATKDVTDQEKVVAELTKAGKAITKESLAASQANLTMRKEILEAVQKENSAREESLLLQQKLARIEDKYSSEAKANTFSRDRAALDIAREELDILEKTKALQFKSKIGSIDPNSITMQQAQLDILNNELDTRKAIATLENTNTDKILEINKTKEKRLVGAATDTQKAEIERAANLEIEKANKLMTDGIAIQNAKLEIQNKYLTLLAAEEVLQNSIKGITESLVALFGESGKALGDTLTSMVKVAAVLEEHVSSKLEAEKKYNDDKNKITKDATLSEVAKMNQIDKIEKQYAKDSKAREMATALYATEAIGQVAGSAKKMFKERTAGYKALEAVEKIGHAAALVRNIQAIASTVATIFPNMAAGVSSLFAQGGWAGFAGAAAFIALMASMGYSGGKASMPNGFTAESQQKVQGTGQMYQDGQLVNRGGGALGDNTAKANSLNNAIDKIEEHSFSTMEYSNYMLDNLKSIKKNTEGLSAMILQSGLNTRGLDVNGEVVTGIGPRKTDMMTKIGDILSGSQLLGALGLGNTGIGKYLDKLNTSIWGGKTKTEILDLGITFSGSINGLVKSLEEGGKGLNAIYQNVKTTVSGGWFRSDKTNITTQFQELEAIQAEAFGSIFKSIGDTVASAAEALGKDPKITTSIMDSFEVVFKTSFEGLKPEEVTGALEAEFSNTFNQLAEKVLPEFQKFRKPGEEFGDTIVRLARDVQVSALVLEASGMAISNIAMALGQGESIQEATVRITESLIDLSGGLEKFVSQGQFFNENFLTEAQRLAPVQARVTKELSRLQSVADKSGVSIKIAGLNTREGFANVVRGLDLTQTSNQDLYAGLMNVAEGFAEVYKETRNTSNVLNDLKKANLDLQDQYDKLTMSEFDYIDKVTKSYTDEEKLQYRQNLALEYTIKALKMDIDYRNMEVDLLRAQGKEVEALALSRELEMQNMSRSEKIVQLQINTRKDEIKIAQEATNIKQKYANLEVELLRAQGKESQALALSRERELATIDTANRELQQSVYARENEIKLLQEATNIKQKYANLEVELLRAQGKESEALALSRKIELDTIDPVNRGLQESVYAREDEIRIIQAVTGIKQKYADLEVELLRAQGKESQALALSRERELATIDPANHALQESVYAREDEIAAIEAQKKIRQLEIDGLSALGYSYEALVRSRTMELEGLTEAEVKLKQYIFAVQDKMATDNLQIDLMEAMGDISAATTARRRLELRGMSAVDQQLKIRIWRLQDEKEILDKHNQQQITILELLGKKSEALALSRNLELETMDAQLRPAQQYIWALEDEKALKDELQEAYDKQKDTLKSTVSTLKDASRAIKDYRAELLQSNLSVLNPTQKYAEAKQQALNLAAIATSVATTETQRLEKESAISKLPGATNAWLEASRTLYASSEAYTSDFNTVLSILDQTSAALDAQQTDAEKQLIQLETSNGYLSELKDSSRSVETILKELVIATNKVAEAKVAVPAVTPTASSPFAVATTGASGSLQDASWVGSKGLKTTSKEIAATINSMVNSDPYGLYNKYVSEGFSSQMVDSIMGYAPGTALDWAKTLGLPAFAKGGLASGVAMVGEYGREVVDFQNPGRVYSANNTSMMMGNTQELVSEIRALRAEVAKLREEQREQTGDLIKSNYDANGMTADTVKAANDANANNWKERNQFKLA